ncbi:MAG TPA: hypothetical protein VGM64_15090 [Lacunisphaera sp.]
MKLREIGDRDADEAADRLRNLLSEWLTVPAPFDGAALGSLRNFGSPVEVGVRWGLDIRTNYEIALRGALDLQEVENPARTCVRNKIRDLRKTGQAFKIYCHRTTRPHFDSLLAPDDQPLAPENFLHSVREYRDSEIFDTMIKVGPLRSWGWGSAPDAIRSAPRFATLAQIVWAGCGDEPGFGYDPVAPSADAGDTKAGPVNHDEALVSRVSWTPHVTRFGADSATHADDFPVEDDFQIFGSLNTPGEKRRAILVRIGTNHGILYPARAQIFSFDPEPRSRAPIWRRQLGESLLEGMFVIRQRLDDIFFGGQKVEHDHYSQIWKSRLREEIQNNPDALVRRLRASGINLASLTAVIHNWCLTPTTVIHAPHSSKHFEILIGILGVGSGGSDGRQPLSPPWWQRAWSEIRHSRGDAIQAGIQEHEIIDDQLLVLLFDLLPRMRELAVTRDEFSVALPADNSVHGTALFNKVVAVEDGFLAPDTELKVVMDLNAIEQWRA